MKNMVKFKKDSLKEERKPKLGKLINLRVEEKTLADFRKLCKEKLDDKSVSNVLRKMMHQLLAQYHYKGYK
jgi:hypothetical protein